MLWYSNCRKKSRKISVRELDSPEKSMLCLTFRMVSVKIRNKMIHTINWILMLACRSIGKRLDLEKAETDSIF